MATRPTLHLISGLPCTGKTTYAKKLSIERDAAYFSLDYWLLTSFGRYPVDVVGHGEHVRRVYACRELIWSAATELLLRGADVILDDGFFLQSDRVQHINSANEVGAAATIHFVNTPDNEVRSRVAARNNSPGTSHFEIATDALDAYIAFFETPTAEEGAALLVIDGSSRPRPKHSP